jgi:hypothetical protein
VKKTVAKAAPSKVAAAPSRAAKAPAGKAAPTKAPAAKTPAAAVKKAAPAKKAATATKAPAAKAGTKGSGSFDAAFLESQKALLMEERANLLGQAQHLEDEAAELMEYLDPGDVQFVDESGRATAGRRRKRDLASSGPPDHQDIDARPHWTAITGTRSSPALIPKSALIHPVGHRAVRRRSRARHAGEPDGVRSAHPGERGSAIVVLVDQLSRGGRRLASDGHVATSPARSAST